MNICLLFSVCAPIGLDRSRKVAGFERSRVYRGKKEINQMQSRRENSLRDRQKRVASLLTGSQQGPRGRPDTASDRCMFAQRLCSGASNTQSYLFPLSGRWQKDIRKTEIQFLIPVWGEFIRFCFFYQCVKQVSCIYLPFQNNCLFNYGRLPKAQGGKRGHVRGWSLSGANHHIFLVLVAW